MPSTTRTTLLGAALACATAVPVVTAPTAAALNTDSLMPAPASCGVDPAKLARETPGPFPGRGWVPGVSGNVCGNLGYVFLETEGGTGSSPTQVILLHRGRKLATQPPGNTAVALGASSDVHVQLRFMQRPPTGQPTAEATFEPHTYVWNPLADDAALIPFPI